MEISYGRVATSSTWVMPGSADRSSRTRSPSRLSVRSSAGPEIATSSTWRRMIASSMIGFSASSGKVSMASTRDLTSLSSFWTSAPRIASTSTRPTFSLAVERISSMPSRSWIASSMRMTTPSSTSSGAAPG